MMQFDRMTLGKQARELGFVRDTFEKVSRLADILTFFQNDPLLSEKMALKGGTAINLTIFNGKKCWLRESWPLNGLENTWRRGDIPLGLTQNSITHWIPSFMSIRMRAV